MMKRVDRRAQRWYKLPRRLLGLFALSALLAAVLVGVSAGQIDPSAGNGPPGEPPGLAQAIAVKKRNTDRLLDIEGVVGAGVSRAADGEHVITVFTQSAGVRGIPKSLDGVQVVEEVTGMIVARDHDPTGTFRPVLTGISIGHGAITAGSTAGLVTKEGHSLILSNNHVLANGNNANSVVDDGAGDNILQPGPYDGGQDPADAIGVLYDFVPIDFSSNGSNTVDAAVALASVEVHDLTPHGGHEWHSLTTVSPALDQKVQKYGRTTRQTHGIVTAIDVTVDVCYETRGPFRCVLAATFHHQFAIEGTSATPDFSAGGDSGSLIVSDDGKNNPVGLLFAGSATHTFANEINNVLTELGELTGDLTFGTPSTEPNNPPVANAVSDTTTEDTSDTWFPDVSDDDEGTILTCTADATSANGGAVTVESDCSSGTYDPAPDFNGSDTFTYTVSDGSLSDSATVTYTVVAENDPPVANAVSDTTTENTSDTWFPDVSDPDAGDTLTCTADATSAKGGAVTVASDCSSGTYDPPLDFSGGSDDTDTFTYTVVSDGSLSDSATVTYTVNKPAAGVSVDSIVPNVMQRGTTVDVTITGTGFVAGAAVTLLNGSGPTPTVSDEVVSGGSTTITATITASGGGPPRNRVWDVRVTNPDGSSGVLDGGFTVEP